MSDLHTTELDLLKSLPFISVIHQSIVAADDCGFQDFSPVESHNGCFPVVTSFVDCLTREEVREVWRTALVGVVGSHCQLELICSVRAILTILQCVYNACKV